MASSSHHSMPKPDWLMSDEENLEEEDSWSVSQHIHLPTASTSFRVTCGNKRYALSAAVTGEFDSTKKVISDQWMLKKYR